MIATNQDGMVTFMNPLSETLTGWKQEEALNKPLSDVFEVMNEEPGTMQKIYIKKILRGEGPELSNGRYLISRNGKKTPIDPRLEPIKNEGGDISGMVLAFTDITPRKKAEDELKKSWERQKLAMEGTVQAIAFTIETRDPYTAGHQRRVTKLACIIGEDMKLSVDSDA